MLTKTYCSFSDILRRQKCLGPGVHSVPTSRDRHALSKASDVPVSRDTIKMKQTKRTDEINRRKSLNCDGGWQQRYSDLHKRILNGTAEPKFLIYNCEVRGCGGYGNRLFGLISLLYLAVLTDRAFLINWQRPKPLETYLQPRNIQWNFDIGYKEKLNTSFFWWSSGGKRNKPGTKWFVLSERDKLVDWFERIDFSRAFDKPAVVITSIWNTMDLIERNRLLRQRVRQLGIVPLLRGNTGYWGMGCGFEYLFKKTGLLERKLEHSRNALQLGQEHFVIGLHIRTGDRSSFDAEQFDKETNRYLKCFLANAERVGQYYQNAQLISSNISWFLATDNIKLKAFVMKHMKKYHTLPLKPRHIAREARRHGTLNDDGLLDVFADHFMLSTCNFLLLSARSTFGSSAAGVGMLNREEFAYATKCSLLAHSHSGTH